MVLTQPWMGWTLGHVSFIQHYVLGDDRMVINYDSKCVL